MEYRRNRNSVSMLCAHLVFATKYRRDVMSDRVISDLRAIMSEICSDYGAVLRECDGESDHIHLLIEYPPSLSLVKLINQLKGVSSRRIRQRRYPEVISKLWGTHFWSPSYFVVSCGGVTLDVVKKYIENQRCA